MGRFNSSRILAMILLKDEARSTSTGEKTPQLDPLPGGSLLKVKMEKRNIIISSEFWARGES